MGMPVSGTWFRVGILRATLLDSGVLLVEIDNGTELGAANFRALVSVMRSMYDEGAFVLFKINGVRTTNEMRRMLVGATVETCAIRSAAFVVESKLGEMLGHFVTRVAKPQFDVKVCGSLSKGHDWLQERIQEHSFNRSALRAPQLGDIEGYPNVEHGVGELPRI